LLFQYVAVRVAISRLNGKAGPDCGQTSQLAQPNSMPHLSCGIFTSS
jgi:hypothetical protein